MDLSDEAKSAIAEAVKIVKEDKLYAHVMASTKSAEPAPVTDPVTDPTPPITEPVDPNAPVSPPPKDPPEPAPESKKRGLYWGSEE